MAHCKPIPGFEGLYEVDRQGNVFSCRRFVTAAAGWQRLQRRKRLAATVSTGHRGSTYLRVSLRKDGTTHHLYVHRLVLLTFRGQPPRATDHARHLNGDGTDNRLFNLAWGTASQNERDKRRKPRATRGQGRQTADPAAPGYEPPF